MVEVIVDGRTFRASHGTVLGREPQDGIKVEHGQVSRNHAQLLIDAGTWTLKDLGSTNGLSQGHGRVDHVTLSEGQNFLWLGPPETAPAITIIVSVPQQSQPQRRQPPQSSQPVSNREVRPQEEPALADSSVANNLGRYTSFVELSTNEIVIGRDVSCDITLNDPLVSRKHAQLSITNASGLLKDLGSANGTFLNGQRIKEAAINEGDLVEIGHIQFVLRDGALQQHIAYGLPLVAQQLGVSVGKTPILQNVNFSLPAGSMTAIVGPSGSGKTTLLNALTGRRKADVGRVFLGGRDLYSDQESIGRSIGFVPQDDPVHLTLTVRKALTAAAQLRLPSDTTKAEIAANVEKVADDLGLTQRLDTVVKALSGGQRKRVSVGYETVGQPQAIILDEPTSGLDPGLERELMLSLRALANKGTTTLVVTHSVQSVELCDQVIVLAPGGRLAFIGSPGDVAETFGCETIAEVFTLLSNSPAATQWPHEAHGNLSPQEQHALQAQTMQADVVSASRRSFMGDLTILTRRYIASLWGEKRRLAMLFAQPPILGILLAITLGKRAFSPQLSPDAYYYVFSTALIMTWFGSISSVREIVDEKSVFRRERAVGVSSTAFILSKWLVLCVIVFVQALTLHFTASALQNDRIGQGALFGSAGELEYVLALSGIGIACVGLGLIISSVAKDAPRAVTILPLVLVGIVLFSGLLLPTAGRLGIEQFSYVNPVQWGGSSAAATVDLLEANNCNQDQQYIEILNDDGPEALILNEDFQEILAEDGVEGAKKALAPNALTCSPRWNPTPANQTLNFTMLAMLSFAMLAAAGFVNKKMLAKPDNR